MSGYYDYEIENVICVDVVGAAVVSSEKGHVMRPAKRQR